MKSKRQIAINNKKRGKKLEADAVTMAKEMGLSARRAWGSNGEALGEHAEVDVIIESLRFQSKMKKKLPKWLLNHETVDGSIIRMDNHAPMVVISLETFLAAYKALLNSLPERNT